MILDTGAVPRRSAPFIGRSDELATLRAALDRAEGGAPAATARSASRRDQRPAALAAGDAARA
jgi:hypothetical protein